MFTQRLAEFVANTQIKDIPVAVLRGSGHAMTDTMGCALAGTLEPVATAATQWLNDIGARAQSTMWGGGVRTSPAEAAFANGITSHALDFDDSLLSLRGHPSSTIVPAALAVGEAAKSSGQSVLAAYALALEVAGKIARALGQGHYMRGYHATATVGVFSAATAAARLWGLNAVQIQAAWGLCASMSAGLLRNFGTMSKPFHAGHAARNGVMAAWMARNGFTADTGIFDGKNGYFVTYGGGDGERPEDLIALLGKPWEMQATGIYVKRWPCCYCNHRPIGGMLKLMKEHNIGAADVEAVEIGFLPGSDEALLSTNPQTGLEGKFSIEYVASALLLDGKLTLETFTDPMVQRPEIRKLIPKVKRCRMEAEGTFSGIFGYTDVVIVTKQGRFETRVEHTPGSPAWPMSDDDRVEKFLDSAGRVLGTVGAQRLLGLLDNCASLADISELVKATVPAPSAGKVAATAPV